MGKKGRTRAEQRRGSSAMADDEVETVEAADAGAATVVPVQAGSIRKGGHIVIKGRPCKVVDVSTSKTGKHGHAKCKFVGVDIFSGKKHEHSSPSTHNCDVPNIIRMKYQLLSIGEGDLVSLMDSNGNTRDDLTLPEGTDKLDKLSADITTAFTCEGRDLILTVVSAMGEEQIQSMKDMVV